MNRLFPRRLRILLVEDHQESASVISALLRARPSLNYEVTSTPSLRALEASLGNRRFDVILADVRLPNGYGVEVVRRITRAVPNTPLIVFASEPDETTRQTLLATPEVWDYCQMEDLDSTTLQTAIERAISRFSQSRDLLRIQEKISSLELTHALA